MNTLGIVIARAGSRGLPGKHLRPLLGRPVVAHALDHAEAARSLTRVCVSSDCATVLNLGRSRFFEAVRRPSSMCDDHASVQGALLHALDEVERRSAWRADAVVLLYGNVPVRPAGLIDRAVRTLGETGCCSVRSFTPVGKWHPAWMSRLDGDRVSPLAQGSVDRRQDLEPLWLHDGGVVAVSRDAMDHARETPNDPHAFFGRDRRGVEVRPGEVIEVDELRDLYLAEATLRAASEQQVRLAA